jgi:hypothetical protein
LIFKADDFDHIAQLITVQAAARGDHHLILAAALELVGSS